MVQSKTARGLIFVVLAVTGYSMLPVFTDGLYRDDMGALDIATWRYLVAVPLFWLFAAFQRRVGRPAGQPDSRPLPVVKVLLTGILLAAAGLFAFEGLQLIPAGTFVVIFYTYPAIVAVISLFLGDRLSVWGWVAIALSLVGVALTAPDFSAGLSGDNLTGVLYALGNATVVAVYFVLSSRLLRGTNAPAVGSALACTGALVLLLVVALISGGARPPSTLGGWLSLLLLAVFSTIMPVFSLTVAIQALGPARAAVFNSFEPLTTAALALIFLGQAMAPVQWLGGLVIVASIILLQTLGQGRSDAQIAPRDGVQRVAAPDVNN
jgi:drug/metabolite transporter (DMT)-like permease